MPRKGRYYINRAVARIVKQHQEALAGLNLLASNETQAVLSVTTAMTFEQSAQYVRKVLPSLAEKYGNVAASLGLQHYERIRKANNVAEVYNPLKPSLDYKSTIANILDYGIGLAFKGDNTGMVNYMKDEITTVVASYDRDTVEYNANNDVVEVRIQRVAEHNACSWCIGLALNDVTYKGFASKSGNFVQWANHWHANCHCTSEILFPSKQTKTGFTDTIRPAYYDNMQERYNKAQAALDTKRAEADALGLTAKNKGNTPEERALYNASRQTAKNLTHELNKVS